MILLNKFHEDVKSMSTKIKKSCGMKINMTSVNGEKNCIYK